MIWHCEACDRPAKSYLNDSPFDVQLTPAVAASRGLADGDIVEGAWFYGLTAWGIVRVVDAPAKAWPTWGRKTAR
jgi:hypothetical protein